MAFSNRMHVGGGDEGEGRGENQVASLDAGGTHAQVQPGGARVDADGMFGAGIVAEIFFEGGNLRAHAEVGTFEHMDDGLDVVCGQAGLTEGGGDTSTVAIDQVGGGHGYFFGEVGCTQNQPFDNSGLAGSIGTAMVAGGVAPSRPRSTASSMRIWPRRKAPSSVAKAVVTISPQTRPVERISTFWAEMLPLTAPATMTLAARTFRR